MPLSALLTAVLLIAAMPPPAAEAAGKGKVGAYSVTNEHQGKRLTGCPLSVASMPGGSGKSVQRCAAECRSRAPSCAAFSHSAADGAGACELSTGAPGAAGCQLTAAEGWVTFSLADFGSASPPVGVCEGTSNQCQNSGICLSRTEQADGSFVCACQPGFTGTKCETPVALPSWSSWSDFNPCSSTCGLGVRRRSRNCLDAEGKALATVAACGSDSPDDYEVCNVTVCPTWSSWSSWSVCNTTATCGPGVRQRTRTCLSGGAVGTDCLGNAVESTPCSSVSCSAQDAPVSLNAVMVESMVVGKGYVQIYSDTYAAAGYVCSDGFDNDKEGAVVCRSLGFDGVQSLPDLESLPSMPTSAAYFLTNLECSGTEQTLQSCQHSPWSKEAACTSGRAAYVLCKVNGRWSPWDSWESCEGKCGSATRNRNRTCTGPRPLGGLGCNGANFQEAACPGLAACPVDGSWGPWSAWTDCTATCGGGSKTRARKCTEPQHGGADCSGDSSETADCNTAPCPSDGYYEPWSSWGACNATCGGGSRQRGRVCVPPANGGKPCSGAALETLACATNDCPVDGGWGSWSPWSSCSVTCGGGRSTRQRVCDSPAPNFGGKPCTGDGSESQECNKQQCPVDGVLTEWSDFSACSATCGGGSRTRRRTCVGPFHGGAPCDGALEDTETCNSQPCPVHGGWGSWTSWGACNVTCGGGHRQRSRQCDQPVPAHGGDDCAGAGRETDACGAASCPVDGYYEAWSAWSACSRTCGGGTRTRERVCVPPRFGGLACAGDPSETGACMTQACPIPGNWLAWQAWGHCSKTCDGGVRLRSRQCDMTSHGELTIDCVGDDTESQACNSDKECQAVRSCQDLKNSGINYDMATIIDPDGPTGPVEPFGVTCQLSGSDGFGYTVVNTTNMSLPGVYAHGSEAGGSIHIRIGYEGGVTASALNSLARASLNCSQYVRYTCQDAGIHYQNNVYLQATYWVNHRWQQMSGWGQPYSMRHQSVCACHATASCGSLTTNVGGIDTVVPATCNCDRNERAEGIYDEGTIYDKDNLPVNEVWVGDTGDDTEFSFTFVGPLVCWGLE